MNDEEKDEILLSDEQIAAMAEQPAAELGQNGSPLPKVGTQLDPTGDLAKNLTPEELLAEVNIAKKNRWLGIFLQFCRSDRFLRFIERNFVIQDRVDEEKKQISTVIYENPKGVGPDLTKAQVAKIFTLLKMYNCRHPQKVLQDILVTLGQPEASPSIITSATEEDVKEAATGLEIKE